MRFKQLSIAHHILLITAIFCLASAATDAQVNVSKQAIVGRWNAALAFNLGQARGERLAGAPGRLASWGLLDFRSDGTLSISYPYASVLNEIALWCWDEGTETLTVTHAIGTTDWYLFQPLDGGRLLVAKIIQPAKHPDIIQILLLSK